MSTTSVVGGKASASAPRSLNFIIVPAAWSRGCVTINSKFRGQNCALSAGKSPIFAGKVGVGKAPASAKHRRCHQAPRASEERRASEVEFRYCEGQRVVQKSRLRDPKTAGSDAKSTYDFRREKVRFLARKSASATGIGVAASALQHRRRSIGVAASASQHRRRSIEHRQGGPNFVRPHRGVIGSRLRDQNVEVPTSDFDPKVPIFRHRQTHRRRQSRSSSEHQGCLRDCAQCKDWTE